MTDTSAIWPSRKIVNLTTTSPATSWRSFQFLRIRSIIVVRYSGQQKSPTSRYDPEPAPPPLDSPKPPPRVPVSATADPAAASVPRIGVRPRASGGACFTAGVAAARAGFTPGLGSVISGVFAAGGRAGSGRAGAGGASACTGRPPIAVIPPFCGPAGPPPSVIVITDLGSSIGAPEPAVWREQQESSQDRVRHDGHGDHPLEPAWFRHSIAQHIGHIHWSSGSDDASRRRPAAPHRSPGRLVTSPTFVTPAACSRSNTSIKSSYSTPRSPWRNTCFSVSGSTFWRIRS